MSTVFLAAIALGVVGLLTERLQYFLAADLAEGHPSIGAMGYLAFFCWVVALALALLGTFHWLVSMW